MIRKAFEKDIDAVEKAYRDLLVYEKANGSNSNWVLDAYPTRKTAEEALFSDSLYVLEEDGEIRASMILNNVQLEEYKKISWEFPAEDDKVKVVHTLCIPPYFAGRGYGRRMMEFAENEAKKSGFEVFRIDTYAGNKPAAKMYEGLGFRYAGRLETLFMDKIPEELIFFEKKL